MNAGDVFSRFLFYSFVIHAFVFGYFIFDPLSNKFSRKNIQIKSAIRVDSIGLPELLRKTEKALEKSPQAQITKKKNPALKKPAPKVKTEKKTVSKVKIKKSKTQDRRKVKKKKDIKNIKQEQSQALDKIKELTNIQEQQSQAIDKVKALESIEQIQRELEEPQYVGSALSKGTSQEGEVVEDFETLQYFTSVRAHINMYWSLPQELADKNLRAEIYAVINSEGAVLKGEIIKSSGNEDFDARVLETIKRASPLPKPPTKQLEKLLSKGVVFKFPE